MKIFSKSWIKSKKPGKQRKYRAEAPLHIKHKFLSANLSKALRQKYGRRSVSLRKGDEVKVMRGSFKKKKAKIMLVDLKNTRIALEGIQRTKKDGTKVNVYFNPRALQIQTLNLDDKERISALSKSKKSEDREEKNVSEKTESNN